MALSRPRRTRQQILDGLEMVLATDNETFTIQTLADAAGVSVGTIYLHFDEKFGLPLILALDRTAPQINALAERYEQCSPARRVWEIGNLLMTAADQSTAHGRGFASPRTHYLHLIQAKSDPTHTLASVVLNWMDALQTELRAAQCDGALCPKFHSDAATDFLRTYWHGALVLPASDPRRTAWPTIAELLFGKTLVDSYSH